MCDCFFLGSADTARSASRAVPDPSGSRTWARRPADVGAWVDVHAHPGRCFLRGLSTSDPLLAVLGADDVEGALAEMRAGGLSVVAFATVADLRVLTVDPSGGLGAGRSFEPGEAYQDHQRQLEALRGLADLDRVELTLEPTTPEPDRIGVLIACEGGDFLEERLERVEEAAALGVRSIALVHYRVNELGDIQTEAPVHGGLTRFGADVVREMNRLGLVVDLAHATFDVTKQVLDISEHPVMISHSHLAATEDAHPRLLSRNHALAVAKNGGLVGAWPAGVALHSFADYLDEILRLIDLMGVEHVAIGTDMDANFKPVVENYGEFPGIANGLSDRGLSDSEVAAVMGGNFWRIFAACRA